MRSGLTPNSENMTIPLTDPYFDPYFDWAESCGVSRYLIRISVGLEDPEEIWQRLNRALNQA